MKLSAHRLGFGWNARLVLAAVIFLLGGPPAPHAAAVPERVVNFPTNAVTVDQSQGSVTLTVNLTVAPTAPVTVQWATYDGTASSPTNYTAASGTLVFDPADPATEGSQTITIQLGTGTAANTTTAFTVVLSNVEGDFVLGPNSPLTVTITNVPPPTVQLSSATYSVNESAGSAPITVTLSAIPTATVTVNYSTADGTAVAGTNYTATSGMLTFNPGDPNPNYPNPPSQTFTVPIINNGVPGPSTYFTVQLGAPGGAALGTPSTAIVTIVNDNPPLPTVQFSSPTYSANETDGSVAITVTLSAIPTATVTVNYSTADGTAIAGINYTATSGMLTFNPGDPNPNYPNPPSQTFTVPILDNGLAGATTNFTVQLGAPSGATLGTPSTATVTIVDNDGPPSPVSVTATGGTFSPNPAPVGTLVQTTLSARATRPTPPAPYTLSPPSWSWQFASAKYSEASAHGPWRNWAGNPSYIIVSDPGPPPDATYDYSSVTLFASFPVAAYWKIGYNATVDYTDSAGHHYGGHALANGNGTAFDVTILRRPDKLRKGDPEPKYAPIDPKARDILPGTLIDLKADVTPAGLDVTFEWQQPPGKVYESYTMDNKSAVLAPVNEKGKLTDLPLAYRKNQVLKFYWADSGTRVVKCKVPAGATETFDATLVVGKPSVDPPCIAFQGEVGWNKAETRIQLNPEMGNRGGIEFVATAKVPEGYSAGTWEYVQTMVPSRKRTLKGGKKQHFYQNGLTVLDGFVPYAFDNTPQQNPAGPYGTGRAGTAGDTPSQLLYTDADAVAVNTEKFKMYIMFKPAGLQSTWVPRQYMEWYWKGTGKRVDGKWTLMGAGQGPDDLSAKNTTDHPVWTQTFPGTAKWEDDKSP